MLPWSPERLSRLPAAAEGPAPALASALPLPPPQLTAASVGVPTGTSSPNSFPGHRLRDMEPQAVVPALRRLWCAAFRPRCLTLACLYNDAPHCCLSARAWQSGSAGALVLEISSMYCQMWYFIKGWKQTHQSAMTSLEGPL